MRLPVPPLSHRKTPGKKTLFNVHRLKGQSKKGAVLSQAATAESSLPEVFCISHGRIVWSLACTCAQCRMTCTTKGFASNQGTLRGPRSEIFTAQTDVLRNSQVEPGSASRSNSSRTHERYLFKSHQIALPCNRCTDKAISNNHTCKFPCCDRHSI